MLPLTSGMKAHARMDFVTVPCTIQSWKISASRPNNKSGACSSASLLNP